MPSLEHTWMGVKSNEFKSNEFGSVRIAWPVWNVAKHDGCGVARWLWLQDFVSLCLTVCHRIEIKILISSPGVDPCSQHFVKCF